MDTDPRAHSRNVYNARCSICNFSKCSNYVTETDVDIIKKVAENGGRYNNYYFEDENKSNFVGPELVKTIKKGVSNLINYIDIEINESSVKTVIRNLLSNSIKFSIKSFLPVEHKPHINSEQLAVSFRYMSKIFISYIN